MKRRMNTFSFRAWASDAIKRKKYLRNLLGTAVFATGMALSLPQADAQTWYWVKNATGGATDITGSATPASGHTYVTGNFYGSLTYGPGATTITDPGNGGGFLTRLNTNGNPMWTVGLTGTLFQNMYTVAATNSEIFVAGASSGGTAVLEGKNGTSHTFSGGVAFVARYNTLGEIVWVVSLPVGGYAYRAADIELNASQQRVYVSGKENNMVRTLCYSYAGALQWADNANNSSANIKSGGLAVDPSGNTHVLLSFQGSLTIQGNTFTTPSGYERLLLYRMNSSGTYVTGYVCGTGTNMLVLTPKDIDSDGSGNLFIATNYSGSSLTIANAGGGSNTVTNSGLTDVLVTRFSPGYSSIWRQKTSGTGTEFLQSMCVDNSGNVFCGIQNANNNSLTLDCYPPFRAQFGVQDNKVLLIKYTLAGAIDWIASPRVNSDVTSMSAVSTNGNGSAIVSGKNSGSSVFGSTTLGSSDMAYSARVVGLKDDLVPQVSGPSALCEGSPFTFTGSLASGTIPSTHYYWEMQECDASGNPVPGGYNWNFWYLGIPSGSFTFPSTSGLPCGRYYRIKLVAVNDDNSCPDWAEASKVVYYSCKPYINAGADREVCQGSCTMLGTLFGLVDATYTWTSGGSVIGSGYYIFVCPTVPTTYTLTITNQYGCTSTDNVLVTISPNDPSFSATVNTTNPSYFTITANANYTSPSPYLQPGFMFDWMIEELNTSGGYTPYYSHHGYNGAGDNSCWWTFPSQTFKGYISTPGSFTQANPCNSSSPAGRFLYGKTYRITRTTWNNNCPERSYSILLSPTYGKGNEGPSVMITEDVEGPDVNATQNEAQKPADENSNNRIQVYPNPGNGVFNVVLNNQSDARLAVTDLFGKQIQNRIIPAGTGSFTVDITGYAPGMYLLHITMNGETSTHKIVLQ